MFGRMTERDVLLKTRAVLVKAVKDIDLELCADQHIPPDDPILLARATSEAVRLLLKRVGTSMWPAAIGKALRDIGRTENLVNIQHIVNNLYHNGKIGRDDNGYNCTLRS